MAVMGPQAMPARQEMSAAGLFWKLHSCAHQANHRGTCTDLRNRQKGKLTYRWHPPLRSFGNRPAARVDPEAGEWAQLGSA